jgi:ComF family protein
VSKILDLFFPKDYKCIFCGRETKRCGICEECYKTLPFIGGKVCSICGTGNPNHSNVCIECKGREFSFKRNISICDYDGELRTKIVSFKQEGNKHIGRAFAWLVADKIAEMGIDVDYIIPMPISIERFKERGFNQTEVLCELLDKELVRTDILVRVKNTPHQTGLSRENRETNLKAAFQVVDKKVVKGKKVLLIDDIYTTGSTLNESAETLMQAGAKEVYALTLARSPIKKSFEN